MRYRRHRNSFLVLIAACVAAPGITDAAVNGLIGQSDTWFRAGRYARQTTLKKMSLTDLAHARPADNISGLLELARDEGRLDGIKMMQLSRQYQMMQEGDRLLLICLRHAECTPDVFARNVNASFLHAQIVARNPGLGTVQANHAVGVLTERMMHRYFQNSGWTPVEGEIGRQGIDGLYVKMRDGVVRDVLVAESKYNSSTLQITRDGAQMSHEWIRRRVANLRARFPQNEVYVMIERFVDAQSYRSVLWHMSVDQNKLSYSLSKVMSKGGRVELSRMDGVNPLLSSSPSTKQVLVANPEGSFDAQFLAWFNEEMAVYGPALPAH